LSTFIIISVNKKNIGLKNIYIFTVIACMSLLPFISFGQDDIELKNPSFEGYPTQGTFMANIPTPLPKGWYDCGRIYFPEETPPDVHPNNYWENTVLPSEGETYIGNNETWESVSQRLNTPLKKDQCYTFSIDLARSKNYWSRVKDGTDNLSNYSTPAVLRVWGGTGFCNTDQLIAESKPVVNADWESYTFQIEVNSNYRFITFEAFYKTPILEPYIGHILLDNISSFKAYNCNEEEIVAAAVTSPASEPKKKIPPHKRAKKKKPVKVEPEAEVAEASTERDVPKKKIMEELDRKSMKKGQKITMKNLYFAADSDSINVNSYSVLDELFDFLKDNEDISIEIGGHTNGVKGITDSYCDNLSNKRAQQVANYLVRKGIEQQRLEFKGYGKRQPIASNKTKAGRKKNQRVEIKILSLGG
jgi:outer membrane protein OmpA-like peptidoglycan-associated protein